jgi:hypothetical protein
MIKRSCLPPAKHHSQPESDQQINNRTGQRHLQSRGRGIVLISVSIDPTSLGKRFQDFFVQMAKDFK